MTAPDRTDRIVSTLLTAALMAIVLSLLLASAGYSEEAKSAPGDGLGTGNQPPHLAGRRLPNGGDSGISITKPALIYGGLGLADLASTRWAMSNGATEGNPLLRSKLELKHVLLASALTATDVTLQKHGRKRSARVLRFAALAIAGRAVVINIRNARR